MGASAKQRERVRDRACLVCGDRPCDSSHLWSRSMGGCAEPDCVLALCRTHHRALDEGRLDILPYLIAHGALDELCHALRHANGDLLALLERCTGDRYEIRQAA